MASYTLHSLDLKGKKIINLENGKVIATVNDVLFDPGSNAIAALLTAKAGLFNRATEIVQRKDINLLGQDVVLANRADVLVDMKDVSGADQWLPVSDRLRGISVLTSEGTRMGKLQDLVVDEKGNVSALLVSDMNGSKTQEIPNTSLRSIGKDAIIIEPAGKATRPEEVHTVPNSTVGVFETRQPERDVPPEPVDRRDLHTEEHGG